MLREAKEILMIDIISEIDIKVQYKNSLIKSK